MDYRQEIEEAVKVVRAQEQAQHREFTDEEVAGHVRAYLFQKYIERVGTGLEKEPAIAADTLTKTLQFAEHEFYCIVLSDLRRVGRLIDHRTCEAKKWVAAG
jgi:hypothetical protein